uniref:RING-type E3 ubiquitin transferase n=1 Tax=Terrapene triunguis TaxID=2587831 RepID=A0A674J116_9SAUR
EVLDFSLFSSIACPVCLEYFKDPVIIDCGHNFCRACIAQCWERSATVISCPQCRETVHQRNLRPNRQLANIVEISKRLSFQAVKGEGGERVCGEHQETLKLFCEEDQTLICVVCDRSQAHRAHTVVPVEEAAQEYKTAMSLTIPFPIALQKQIEKERQKIVSEFQQLRQFLEEQERLLLAQLEKLDKEIVKIRNENNTILSEEISHLSELMSELEGKYQKPTSEFLQDRGTSVRSRPVPARTGLLGRVKNPASPRLMNVTLDPDTAHPNLVLSADWKSVRWEYKWQRLPDNPERFDTVSHCLEVEVVAGRYWAVGVARESVRRKGVTSLSPEGGIWAVEQCWGQFWALTSPMNLLPLSWVPSRIRVCLDCDWGQVSLIDVGDEAPIFTFPLGSVPGERIRPWLWVGPGSPLILCP